VPQESGAPGVEMPAERAGLSLRAFLIGLVLCVFLGLALDYNEMAIRGSILHWYFIDRGALFVFLCLVLMINPLLTLLRRRWSLRRGELLAVYVMLLLLQPASATVRPLIAYLTGASYYASPERRDLQAVLPHVFPWMIPQGTEVVRAFYEGLPEGAPLPWEAWIVPLVSWGTFLMVLFGVLICFAVLMRKQWEEHERFAFPLMQVPLAMGERGEGNVSPLFRNSLMWAGFAIPLFIGSLKALHQYFHTVPEISLWTQFWVFRRTTPVPVRLSFAILGYTYLVNLDVSLSIWLFNVISRVIRGIMAITGLEHTALYGVAGVVGPYSSQGSALLAFMGMGYMLALAAYSLYVARGHLGDVFATALGRPSRLDDSREIIPYRTALAGIAGGLLYLGCWLYQAGISPPLIFFLFFTCFVVFLVMARIVSETGFVATYSPMDPPSEFVVCLAGSSAFSPAGLVTFGFSYGWTLTRSNTVMGHALGALRLAGGIRRKQGLIYAVGAALLIGLMASSYVTLKLGYTRGGLNLDRFFRDYSVLPFDAFVGGRILEPSPIFFKGFLYTGIGAGIAGVLMVLRTRFVWWPLHPVALPLSTTAYTALFFQRIPGLGHQGAGVEVWRGSALQKDPPFFHGDHFGGGGLCGRVDHRGLFYGDVQKYSLCRVIHKSSAICDDSQDCRWKVVRMQPSTFRDRQMDLGASFTCGFYLHRG